MTNIKTSEKFQFENNNYKLKIPYSKSISIKPCYILFNRYVYYKLIYSLFIIYLFIFLKHIYIFKTF